MVDFEFEGIGEDWVLTPTSQSSRAWCQSHLTNEVRTSGDGYVMNLQLAVLIIEKFIKRKSN